MKIKEMVQYLTLALLILTSLSLPALAETPAQKPDELVWPSPPDQPRVRFIRAIVGEDDFKDKKKVSFFQRLMGEKDAKDMIALVQPYGVTVGDDGRVYVVDTLRREILIFDQRDNSISTWTGNRQVALTVPIGLALDKDSRLFVSDSKGAQVAVFSPEGDVIASISGLLRKPVGLAVDNRLGRLYVGDLDLSAILVYDLKTLKLIKKIENGNSGLAYISAPANMAVGPNGNLFVSDIKKCQVTVFNSDGAFVRSFGSMGDAAGQFARPKGIALDSEGHVYVLDAAFGNFQIFTPEGQLLLFVGNSGTEPGQMLLPAGIAIGKDNRIYVTEQWIGQGRLQIFKYLGDTHQTAVVNRAQ